jgi:hypothetical protein
MEISSNLPLPRPLLTITSQSGSIDLSFLKPGQLLSAQVQSNSADGTLTLNINDRVLKVVSDLQLAQGTTITVKVEIKEGQLALRLITPQNESVQTPQQALRQVLPRQQPMQPLFAQLSRIAVQVKNEPVPELQGNRASTTSATSTPLSLSSTPDNRLTTSDSAALPLLPLKVRQEISALLNRLPSNKDLATPEGIKQAINNSGMFFESRLHTGSDKASLQSDLKTILFRIAFLIRQSLESLPPSPRLAVSPALPQGDGKPPRPDSRGYSGAQQTETTAKQAETTVLMQLLGRQSESSLARVQMHQLTSLNTQQQGEEPQFTLELPIFNGKESEMLKLKIRRETRQIGGEVEACWSVTLKLDNDDYGTIRAVVSLVGKKVSTTFWCEQPETQLHFQQHLEELRVRMQEQGLELGRTQAFSGLPPEPDRGATPLSSGDNLINIQA